MRAQDRALHTVDLLADPVDEAELDRLRLVDLFSEAQQTVADVLVLQVADELAEAARALTNPRVSGDASVTRVKRRT